MNNGNCGDDSAVDCGIGVLGAGDDLARVTERDVTAPVARRRGRGFAVLDKRVHREISATGGRTAHALGKAHRFTPEEARAAGRKGGLATHAKRRNNGANAKG